MSRQAVIRAVRVRSARPQRRFCRQSARFLLSICAALLWLALAGVAQGSSAYVGGGIGLAMSKIDEESVRFDTDDYSSSETSWRIFAGYRPHRHFGLEAGYVALGKGRVEEQVHYDFFETELAGFDITAVGIYPFCRGLSAFARAGVLIWNSDIAMRFTGLGSGTRYETGAALAVGFGGEYAFIPQAALRADFSYYAIDKEKAGSGGFSVISVGGVFYFLR